MKASITFEFNLGEDGNVEDAIQLRLDAPKYQTVLSELDAWLRQKIKYEDVHTMDLHEVREMFNKFVEDNGVDYE